MSLDKSIQAGKEHRKPYRGAKAVDKACRNHGSCAYCAAGRLRKEKRLKLKEKELLADYNFDAKKK